MKELIKTVEFVALIAIAISSGAQAFWTAFIAMMVFNYLIFAT